MIQAPHTLITNRLILRRLLLSDAEAVFEYGSNPEVTRYMIWRNHTAIQDAVAFLEQCICSWNTGKEFCWAITVKPEDQAVGTISCRIEQSEADFGYVLNRKCWGQGYATEAVHSVMSWLMNLPDVDRIWASCDIDNQASARVLEKSSLQYEKTVPRAMIRPNLASTPRDTLVFSRERAEGLW